MVLANLGEHMPLVVVEPPQQLQVILGESSLLPAATAEREREERREGRETQRETEKRKRRGEGKEREKEGGRQG